MINDNNEILRWMEALRSNGDNINPSFIINHFLFIEITKNFSKISDEFDQQ